MPSKNVIKSLPVIGLLLVVSIVLIVLIIGGTSGNQHTTPNGTVANNTPVPPRPTLTSTYTQKPAGERDDLLIFNNATSFLEHWNERRHWGYTDEQIRDYAEKLENQVLFQYREGPANNYHITNLTKFSEELSSIGINSTYTSSLESDYHEELMQSLAAGGF